MAIRILLKPIVTEKSEAVKAKAGFITGMKPAYKKAYVTLPAGEEINFFTTEETETN